MLLYLALIETEKKRKQDLSGKTGTLRRVPVFGL